MFARTLLRRFAPATRSVRPVTSRWVSASAANGSDAEAQISKLLVDELSATNVEVTDISGTHCVQTSLRRTDATLMVFVWLRLPYHRWLRVNV